jgi:hypothetical protein
MNELHNINICDNNYIPGHLEGDLSIYQCQRKMLEMVGTEHLFRCLVVEVKHLIYLGQINNNVSNNHVYMIILQV